MSKRALDVSGRLLAGALVLTSLAACTGEAAGDSCLEREAAGYLAMERTAEEVLGGVDFTMERVGSCEDTGRPWTRLHVTVDEWHRRKVANRHFARHGWSEAEGRLVSPDGDYRMEASRSRGPAEPGTPHVVVTIEEVADEAEWADDGD